MLKIGVTVLAVALLAAMSAAQTNGPASPNTKAIEIVKKALSSLGDSTKSGIVLSGKGTVDLAVRMQGMTYREPDRYPITESFAYHPAENRLAYESRSRVNPDADEWIRYLYDGKGRLQIVELQQRRVFWDVSPEVELQRVRYARMAPQVLLREALEKSTQLSVGERRSVGRSRADSVIVSLAEGENLELLFDTKGGDELRGLEYLIDHPLLGDTRVRWVYSEYRNVPGVGRFPAGYKVFLNDRLYKSIEFDQIKSGARNSDLFTIPKDITVPEAPAPPAGASDASSSTPQLPNVREIVPGLDLVLNVRGGFHVLVKEFGDFLAVVDAPAGYHELQQIPASDWAGEDNSDAVGLRLLETIKAKISTKPVKYVILTHYHSDHTGGIRPFLEAGATVVASPETASVIRSAFGRSFTLGSIGKRTFPRSAEIVPVSKEHTLSDGTNELKIINVGENPHVKGMLVVYAPKERVLYQSDLFEPMGMRFFPAPGRVPVMKWFVRWLDESRLDPERIFAIHGSATITKEHLDAIRKLNDDRSAN